jgi:hypothetical protein
MYLDLPFHLGKMVVDVLDKSVEHVLEVSIKVVLVSLSTARMMVA